jgi:hypothetical protein
MKYHKVRFNLSRGENYMKWKVMYKNGWVRYYHPSEVQLVLRKCILKNSKATAMKIFTGVTTKVVCAWVLCQELEIFTGDFRTENTSQLKYNPRLLPFWNLDGKDMDGSSLDELFSVDYKLFVK